MHHRNGIRSTFGRKNVLHKSPTVRETWLWCDFLQSIERKNLEKSKDIAINKDSTVNFDKRCVLAYVRARVASMFGKGDNV